MNVQMNLLSRTILLIAESIIVLLALGLSFSREIEPSPLRFSGKLVVALLSGLFLLLFALPFRILGFGPLTCVMDDLSVDPAVLAGTISSAVHSMIGSSALLGLSSLLGLIGAVMTNRNKIEPV